MEIEEIEDFTSFYFDENIKLLDCINNKCPYFLSKCNSIDLSSFIESNIENLDLQNSTTTTFYEKKDIVFFEKEYNEEIETSYCIISGYIQRTFNKRLDYNNWVIFCRHFF